MVRMLAGNKIVAVVALLVVALAVWKANQGDVGRIFDSAWMLLDRTSDALLRVWEQAVN